MRDEFTKLAQHHPTLRHDPFVKHMARTEKRRAMQDKMHLMNQLPAHSGWIVLLQNRVELQSVGNIRHKTKVYYDHRTRMVGTCEDGCSTPFRCARLKNGQPAAGWMEE